MKKMSRRVAVVALVIGLAVSLSGCNGSQAKAAAGGAVAVGGAVAGAAAAGK